MVLYEHLQKRDIAKIRFEAALHGAKIKNDPEKTKKEGGPFAFKDPEEYKHLSVEERKKLTDKMKFVHKQWSHSRSQIGKVNG